MTSALHRLQVELALRDAVSALESAQEELHAAANALRFAQQMFDKKIEKVAK